MLLLLLLWLMRIRSSEECIALVAASAISATRIAMPAQSVSNTGRAKSGSGAGCFFWSSISSRIKLGLTRSAVGMSGSRSARLAGAAAHCSVSHTSASKIHRLKDSFGTAEHPPLASTAG